MEKLLISDYKRKHNIQKDSDTYRNLKPSERIFCQRYFRVEIRGKLGRAVYLMISTQEVSAINLILKYRTFANVLLDNPYVFGRGVNKYFEGARCLRVAANNCHADQPALLRGTKLRKHIATVSHALNLTENELSILADYMGLNIDIHRHFYRLPNEAIHLAKISQLLYALDTDKIDKYKGKTLEEINLDADLAIESDDSEGNKSNTSQATVNINECTAQNQININKTFIINTEEAESDPEHKNNSIESELRNYKPKGYSCKTYQKDKEEINSSKTSEATVHTQDTNRSETLLHTQEKDCSMIINSEEEECWLDIKMKKTQNQTSTDCYTQKSSTLSI